MFPRYDIRGFAQSLKQDPVGAVKEALIRHFIGNLLNMLNGASNHPSWISLFRSLLRKRRFLLIVLDDARYDAFERAYNRYLSGVLIKARVPPPNTYGWLPKAFSYPEFRGVRVFYASIGVESHNIRIDAFVPGNREVEVVPIRPNKARDLMTVLPGEVNEAVMNKGLTGRDIIWYAQPHFPWVVDKELSLLLLRDALLHDFVPPDTIQRKLKLLNVPSSRVVNAYYGNLILVLKYIRELINYVKTVGIAYDEVVVTSDHGEMLGELGLYLHQDYNLPQLTIVPWLRVSV